VRASGIYQFRRKAELYAKKTGRKPDRLLIVTPYIEEKAVEASKKLGIEAQMPSRITNKFRISGSCEGLS